MVISFFRGWSTFRKTNEPGVRRTSGVASLSVALLLLLMARSAFAQAESPLEHYMKLAHPLGTAKLVFLGPDSGFTFVHLKTKEVAEWGDTLVNPRTYLIDLNVSNDGLYIAPDTMTSFSDYTPFQFVLPDHHIIHANLAPGHTHQDMLALDTNFNGTIGWGLLKQFITAFDLRKNELTFYPLFSSVLVGDSDTNVIQLPIIDDAHITYCHCPVSTVWLDVTAPPLPEGHVNLGFHQPISQVYVEALDSSTRAIVDRQHDADSASGTKRPIGLRLGQFVLHDLFGHSIDIANRGPGRIVVNMPAIYHDLTVPIMGTLGTDVLRTFSGIIIDPSRNKLIFVK